VETNDAVGSAIRLLEQSLAELVDEIMSDELGPGWVGKVLPHLKDDLVRRERGAGPLRFSVPPVSEVGYLYLGELKSLMVSRRCWGHVQGLFGNKERLAHLIDIVQEVRPAWAHPAATTIEEDTACYVLLTAKKLLEPINQERAGHVEELFRSLIASSAEKAIRVAEGPFGLLSRSGAIDTMRLVAERPLELTRSELVRLMDSAGFHDVDDLLSSVIRTGWCNEQSGRLGLSARGRQILYLSEGIAGGDLRRVLRNLTEESPTLRMYELVTEGMTTQFIEELYEDPTFGSLYLASPWIDLDERSRSLLQAAIDRAEEYGDQEVTLIVITRPPAGAERWRDRLEECISWFRALRADIQFVRGLHTKLFLREPSRGGGRSVALFGSENLTRGRARSRELGIKIRNDSSITRQLVQYFHELYSLRN
jgi:hypothetical protein